MKTIQRTWVPATVLVLVLAQHPLASAATIYDNTANAIPPGASGPVRYTTPTSLISPFNYTAEFGDQITFVGTSRLLTSFSFQLYGTNYLGNTASFNRPVQTKLRLYLNDGPVVSGASAPGTPFYESNWLFVNPTPRSTLVFGAEQFTNATLTLANPIPASSTFTWTVQFRGLNLGSVDEAGVDVYGPPTVGSSAASFWENSGSSWVLKTGSVPMNFAATVEVIPEPSSVALAVIAGFSLVCVRRHAAKRRG